MGKHETNERRVQKDYPQETAWLLNYTGKLSFFQSLLQQVRTKGFLSEKQVAIIRSNMEKEVQAAAPAADPHFSYQPGEQISITSGIARGIMEKRPDLKVCFRNLEIVRVERETQKAVLVDVRFVSKIVTSCHVCGQPLDTEISKACGIGPVCAKKIGFPRPKLKDAGAILLAVEQMARDVGVIQSIWLPKSCIMRIGDTAGESLRKDDQAWQERLEEKNEYARREAEQERQAFMSDPDFKKDEE